MEFSRQEHWSWLPFPSPEVIPDPDFESRSPALQADSLSEPPVKVDLDKCYFFFPLISRDYKLGIWLYLRK